MLGSMWILREWVWWVGTNAKWEGCASSGELRKRRCGQVGRHCCNKQWYKGRGGQRLEQPCRDRERWW